MRRPEIGSALRGGDPGHHRAVRGHRLAGDHRRRADGSTTTSGRICVHGLPNTAPDGFKIPFSAGHIRRMPRLTAGPFRYRRVRRQLPGRRPCGTPSVPVKQAVISPSALSLMYPADEIPGYPREQFIDDLLREHETEVRRCLEQGRAQGPDRLHRGAAGGQDRPLRRAPAQLHRPEQPRAVAVHRRGAAADRRAHLPRRRPRLDPQRGRRLRRVAAQPVRAEGGEFLHRPGGRAGPRPRPEDHPRST